MRLDVEKQSEVNEVTEMQVRASIMSLRSYGPSSFASLTDEVGNYVQVAGGGVTCMLERRDAVTGQHFRGYKDEKSQFFPDGATLAFGGGEIKLQADEWFSAKEVVDVFISFLRKEEMPAFIRWRDVTTNFSDESFQ